MYKYFNHMKVCFSFNIWKILLICVSSTATAITPNYLSIYKVLDVFHYFFRNICNIAKRMSQTWHLNLHNMYSFYRKCKIIENFIKMKIVFSVLHLQNLFNNV